MRNRPYQLFIVDVIIALEMIVRVISEEIDAESWRRDSLRYHATLKMFENVGEAMKYLVDEPALASVKDSAWRGAIALRNVVAHEYFSIDYEEVFRIAKKEAPALLKNFERLCIGCKSDPLLEKAFQRTKQDLINNWEKESAEYLQKLITKCYGK